MVRRLVAFVIAAVVMIVLGSFVQTLFVQEAWSFAAGQGGGVPPVAIPMADRVSWVAHDLIGLEPLYGALTGIALLVSFLVAGLVARFTGLRLIVFAVAGAVAIFVMFTIMRMPSVLGTVGVFGARGAAGLAGQMAVGLIAGLLFAALTGRRSA